MIPAINEDLVITRRIIRILFFFFSLFHVFTIKLNSFYNQIYIEILDTRTRPVLLIQKWNEKEFAIIVGMGTEQGFQDIEFRHPYQFRDSQGR